MPPLANTSAESSTQEFLPVDLELETALRVEGEALFERMHGAPTPSIFSKKGAYARLMEWSMTDPAFKTQLFRFVDVLPSLQSSAEIIRHLREYLGDRAVDLHPALKAGLAASGFAPGLVAKPVKAQITSMAREFVAGESPEDLVKRLLENAEKGVATTIDLLGETVVSEAEADAFLQRNLEVLSTVSTALAKASGPGFSDVGPHGPLPRLNLSIKISALTPDVNPADPAGSVEALKKRLRPILRCAADLGALINFDMESYRFKPVTLALFTSILEEEEFRQRPAVGIAIQAYLRDAEADLQGLITWARSRTRLITVRLVKGAYWDYETILARQRNWPVPVWAEKAETDANYEKLSLLLLEARDVVSAAFATHNVRSCAHVIAQARRLGIEPRTFEFQALFGMADDLKTALVGAGYRVREYCPIGDLLPGMAYLVRRLLENTSNEGFLRAKNLGQASREELLANPVQRLSARKSEDRNPRAENGSSAKINERSSSSFQLRLSDPFRNAPNSDFSHLAARDKLRLALVSTCTRHPVTVPLTIAGKVVSGAREQVASINPAHPQQILGHWSRATLADAEAAIAAARVAQRDWGRRPASERAEIFDRVGDLLETRRFELSALEILEAGKPWLEADADVSEAIDFCRFYAREARRLGVARLTQFTPGEDNRETVVPRGIGAVIAPWNFPLAILCGMTVAAAVTGNAVIMKPAEQTSLLASALMHALTEAGVPPGVITLLTGFGEEVGAHLVAHPAIDFVAFTGSRAVGLKLWETVAHTSPGQRNLKRAVCEMGGKNALIVDADADWDEAIPAVLYSAFGFSGQKCSALSRLILHADIAAPFTERLIAAAGALRVGNPADPATVVGPVIDAAALHKITRIIDHGKSEARLAYQATLPPELAATGGYYVPPTIFTEVKPSASIAREEIFGPVLSVFTARDLDEAFALANDSEYALTAGIFSRSPQALERARAELNAGNIYLNRGITGAIVGRHPFGGYAMSGGGTKAGGRGYLENFVFPRVVSENTLRRGFAPPEAGGE